MTYDLLYLARPEMEARVDLPHATYFTRLTLFDSLCTTYFARLTLHDLLQMEVRADDLDEALRDAPTRGADPDEMAPLLPRGGFLRYTDGE